MAEMDAAFINCNVFIVVLAVSAAVFYEVAIVFLRPAAIFGFLY